MVARRMVWAAHSMAHVIDHLAGVTRGENIIKQAPPGENSALRAGMVSRAARKKRRNVAYRRDSDCNRSIILTPLPRAKRTANADITGVRTRHGKRGDDQVRLRML